MKKIQLNLARGKKTRQTGPAGLLVACYIAVAIFTLYDWHAYKDNSLRLTKYRDVLSSLEVGLTKTEFEGHLKRLKSEAALADKVISSRSFSWTEILTGLEKSLPDGVLLLQINPDFAKRKVEFSGLGNSLESILSMVDNMNRSGLFSEAVLVKHSETENAARLRKPDTMIHFSISSYYEAGQTL